jgi:porin
MQLTAGLRFNEPLPLGFHNTMSLGYARNSVSPDFLPPSMAAWKTEHAFEFNLLLRYGPVAFQPGVPVLHQCGRDRRGGFRGRVQD